MGGEGTEHRVGRLMVQVLVQAVIPFPPPSPPHLPFLVLVSGVGLSTLDETKMGGEGIVWNWD